jgi:hypothetical protein
MVEAHFPPDSLDVDPLDSTPLRLFFHLAIGQPLRPAQDRTRHPASGTVSETLVAYESCTSCPTLSQWFLETI